MLDMISDIHLLTIRETAKRLCVSERFITKLIASGVLPSLKLGRRRLIREAAIHAVLKRHEIDASGRCIFPTTKMEVKSLTGQDYPVSSGL